MSRINIRDLLESQPLIEPINEKNEDVDKYLNLSTDDDISEDDNLKCEEVLTETKTECVTSKDNPESIKEIIESDKLDSIRETRNVRHQSYRVRVKYAFGGDEHKDDPEPTEWKYYYSINELAAEMHITPSGLYGVIRKKENTNIKVKSNVSKTLIWIYRIEQFSNKKDGINLDDYERIYKEALKAVDVGEARIDYLFKMNILEKMPPLRFKRNIAN